MDRDEQQRLIVSRQRRCGADFQPNRDGPMDNQRQTALNYMAYRLGQISQNLGRLADAQEKANQSKD